MDDDISPRDYQLLGLRVQYVFMRPVASVPASLQ